MTTADPYAAAAIAYELFSEPFRAAQYAALDAVLERIPNGDAVVLDIGCGDAAHLVHLLERRPDARAIGLEPSAAMRALALQRVASTALRERITIRPEAAHEAPLPSALDAVVMLGVLGHLDPDRRVELFARLSARMRPGAAVLFDLQQPERPHPIPETVFPDERIGELRYRRSAAAVPDGGERMRWTMRTEVLDGERILEQFVGSHCYHHPSRAVIDAEFARAGFTLDPLEPGYLIATRAASAPPLDPHHHDQPRPEGQR